MTGAVEQCLRDWLRRQSADDPFAWLEGILTRVPEMSARDFDVAFGLVPRRFGRTDLDLSADDLDSAEGARKGWDPRDWTVDNAARMLLLLALPQNRFADTFMHLCRTAEVGESVALYRGLPLYPQPEALEWQVGEGLRTSMRAVFEAIAQRSPYPGEQFSEDRWNHMVLKALFVGSSLAEIQKLDKRANPTLARILGDYARERWAAGRPIAPELWRAMGPFAEGSLLDDLARLSGSGEPTDRRAAALALSASADRSALELLKRLPAEAQMIQRGELTWDTVVHSPGAGAVEASRP